MIMKKQLGTSYARNRGVSLTEAVVASGLLFVSIVPIIKGLTSAQVTSRLVQQKTRSLTLAQLKLEEIKAKSIYSFSTSFTESNTVLETGYLCNVTDDGNENLKTVSVSVGFDDNGNGALSSDETLIVLTTKLAQRWASFNASPAGSPSGPPASLFI